jgi:hypothetical protein
MVRIIDDFFMDHPFYFGSIFLISIFLVICTTIKVLGESSCNERASELSVVDGDYRFVSDTCYLTLNSGIVIPADQYRAVEETVR